MATTSFLLKEVAPVSQDLSAISNAGLQALDNLDRGEPAADAWRAQQEGVMQQVSQPKAGVMIMVLPPIRKLISAAEGTAALPARAN
jgi:hypothetical protein